MKTIMFCEMFIPINYKEAIGHLVDDKTEVNSEHTRAAFIRYI